MRAGAVIRSNTVMIFVVCQKGTVLTGLILEDTIIYLVFLMFYCICKWYVL